jgi:hypothetical protein
MNLVKKIKKWVTTIVYYSSVTVIDKFFDLFLFVRCQIEKRPLLSKAIHSCNRAFVHFIKQIKTEPSDYWICLCKLSHEPNDKRYALEEKYYFDDNYYCCDFESIDFTVRTASSSLSDMTNNHPFCYVEVTGCKEWKNDIIIKHDQKNQYSVSIKSSKNVQTIERDKVDSPFFSIEYLHPMMEKGKRVYIDIPSNYFLEGNELLSATFVKRWLEYYVGRNVPFDKRYRLLILDTELNEIELDFFNYVRITKNGYEIF